jgi:glycosyltransferase involved in cell wall biosynthesis
MRVLFVTHAYPRHPGDAAGSFLHRLALALRAEGIEVHVLAPAGDGLAREESIDGIAVRRFRYAPRRMETLAYAGTMAEQVLGSIGGKVALAGLLGAGTLALRRAIADTRPDVVHAHWWFPGGLLTLGGAGRCPVLLTMHGSDVRLARKVPLAHPVFRHVLARAAEVTAVSSWLAAEAGQMAPGASIEVAPMPADTAAFERASAERRPGHFLFVGRLNAQKGIEDLLEAFAQLPSSATLEVIGTGELEATLKARASTLGCGARVVWKGQVGRDALPGAYASALAVVIPSRDEGLGLVGVEAQLCGTPVIAYASGGTGDVVDPAWGGTLVAAGDTSAIAAAMRARLAAGVASVKEVAPARERMQARFAPAAVAAGYAARYRRLAAHG